MVRSIAFLLTFVALAFPALADDGRHHDELSEQQLGTVHFPISCAPSVQKSFERGVALLHSFAFETAEHIFRQIGQDDPRCAMAHWGIADRKSTRLNSSHDQISYAVFCLKKKKTTTIPE